MRSELAFVLGCGLLLPSCTAFSPDGGMSVVAAIGAQDLGADVVAVHTPQQAAVARTAWRGSCGGR